MTHAASSAPELGQGSPFVFCTFDSNDSIRHSRPTYNAYISRPNALQKLVKMSLMDGIVIKVSVCQSCSVSAPQGSAVARHWTTVYRLAHTTIRHHLLPLCSGPTHS